jgi:hypothetical protein
MSNRQTKIVNRALWTAQVLSALLFAFAGASKFLMSPEQLQQGPVALPVGFIQLIGICEIAGALGLVLPGLFRIRTQLTALAASGLAIIMIGATAISAVASVAGAMFPLVVGVIVLFIAIGRTRLVPLGNSHRRALSTV